MTLPILDATHYLDLALYETGREVCIAEKSISFTPKSYPVLHYVYAGRGSFNFEGREYALKAGDCFMIPAGKTADYKASPEQPWSYFWVGLGGAKADGLLALAGLDAARPIRHDAQRKYKPFFEEIYDSFFRDGFLSLSALSGLYGLFAALGQEVVERGEAEKGHIASAKAFIRNNFQFPIPMIDVAHSVGVSPNYLANLFQSEGEGSPKSYLTATRMEAAKKLLLSSGAPIGEVAKAVGYVSPLYFSKAFRQYYGDSPLHYRAKGGHKE